MPRTIKNPYRPGRPGMRHLWLASLGVVVVAVRGGVRWTARLSRRREALPRRPRATGQH